MRVYALLQEDIPTWENVMRASALVLLVPNTPSTALSPLSSSQYHLVHPSLCCISVLFSDPQTLPWKITPHIRLQLRLLLTWRLSLMTLSMICSNSLAHKKALCSRTHMCLGPWHHPQFSIQPHSNQPNTTLKSKLTPLQLIFTSCPHTACPPTST